MTWERAQQLMEAVVYCIREYETSGAFGVTAGRPEAAQAYKLGYDMAVQKVHEMKSFYDQLLGDFQSYGVLCMEDTVLRGIPEFLKWYDVRYAPQNTLLTLDYPIFMDISKSSGIDAVYVETGNDLGACLKLPSRQPFLALKRQVSQIAPGS